MNSTIPAAIDGLLTLIRGLAAMNDSANPVLVSDGFPAQRLDDTISVGGSVDVVSQATQQYVTIGGASKEERYDIVGLISCSRGGGGDAVQKYVRDRAFALLAAIEDGIKVPNHTLGGVVRVAQLSAAELRQTTDADAGAGRLAEITFTVTCEVRIS